MDVLTLFLTLWLFFLHITPPYWTMQARFDFIAPACGDPAYDPVFDDHIGEITLPVLYIGSEGGAGEHSKGNLLFFGNFCELDEPEFLGGMTSLMEDKIALYEAMMRDIYGLGSVLRLKFSLLRIAYTSFMVALILGVFVWILSM